MLLVIRHDGWREPRQFHRGRRMSKAVRLLQGLCRRLSIGGGENEGWGEGKQAIGGAVRKTRREGEGEEEEMEEAELRG